MKATIAVLLAGLSIPALISEEVTPQPPGAARTPELQNKTQPVGLLRFTELVGTSIRTQDGATLGQVHDIVLDRDTGKVRFALLNKGDSIGVSKQITPVPWEAVSVQAEKKLVINVDRSKIPGLEPAGAPGVDVQTQSSSDSNLNDSSKAPKDSVPAADKDED